MPFKLVFVSRETQASLDHDIEEEINYWCDLLSIDQALVRAIIKKESAKFPFAYRVDYTTLFSQGWYQNTLSPEEKKKKKYYASYGLMQILYGVAKKDCGLTGYPASLFDPHWGIYYGCKLLKIIMKRYPEIKDTLAYYNGGGYAIKQQRKTGKYSNKSYVDKVYKYYLRFKKDISGGSKIGSFFFMLSSIPYWIFFSLPIYFYTCILKILQRETC